MAEDQFRRVVIGRIVGVYGVKGWVKVVSYATPGADILEYTPWLLKIDDHWQRMTVDQGKVHGNGIIAHLVSFDDRDSARALIGAEITVQRNQLPDLPEGEFYWMDLEGLRVVNKESIELGILDHLLETGANDVMVVQGDRERLIPFIRGDIVLDIDQDAGVITVDWDPEY
jgi:16S rRNA processing protein RimM